MPKVKVRNPIDGVLIRSGHNYYCKEPQLEVNPMAWELDAVGRRLGYHKPQTDRKKGYSWLRFGCANCKALIFVRCDLIIDFVSGKIAEAEIYEPNAPPQCVKAEKS